MWKILIAFSYLERNPQFVLGVLCSIGCPVQSVREVFSSLHLCRHTFASVRGDCLRFASLWRANSRGDSCVLGVHLLNVCWGVLFLFVGVHISRVCWICGCWICQSVQFNTLSKVLLWIMPSYFPAWFVTVFGNCVWLLVHASMKPGCLARPPLCHRVNIRVV